MREARGNDHHLDRLNKVAEAGSTDWLYLKASPTDDAQMVASSIHPSISGRDLFHSRLLDLNEKQMWSS